MTESHKKLDARGRRLIGKLDADAQVEIFLRLESAPGPEHLEALRAAGCRIGSGVGDVMTARVTVSRLAELADLPFVSGLQLSRALFDEGSQGRDDD